MNHSFIILFLLIIFVNFLYIIYYYNKENFNDLNFKMYVISLRREDRLKNIEDQQTKINHNIEIIDAVKGDKLDLDNMINDGIISSSWKNGVEYKKREVGCYLSHYNIYNKILSDREPGYTIVFEDDFNVIVDHFIINVNKIVELLNDDFDIIFLGNHTKNHGKLLNDNIFYLDQNELLIGTHSYIINNKNIEKIIRFTKNIDMAIDWKLSTLGKNNDLNILVVYPTLVDIIDSESNIRNMNIETFRKLEDF
jgi:glycosyl transferase family 25